MCRFPGRIRRRFTRLGRRSALDERRPRVAPGHRWCGDRFEGRTRGQEEERERGRRADHQARGEGLEGAPACRGSSLRGGPGGGTLQALHDATGEPAPLRFRLNGLHHPPAQRFPAGGFRFAGAEEAFDSDKALEPLEDFGMKVEKLIQPGFVSRAELAFEVSGDQVFQFGGAHVWIP